MTHGMTNINLRELEKLNIENLFICDDGTRPHTNGQLDINTLFRKHNTDVKNYKFDSQALLSGARKRKQKIQECYMKMYKTCCDTIMSASKMGLTDIIFEVSEYVADCSDYSSTECLDYIDKKLTEEKILCEVISPIKIFISWHKLETDMDKTDKTSADSSEDE